MYRNLSKYIEEKIGFNGATISSDTTTAGEVIDLQGFESVAVILKVDARSAGEATLVLEDSDSVSTGFVTVATDFLSRAITGTKINAANTTERISYIGNKRYLKVSILSADSANLYVSALVVKGDPISIPTVEA